MDEKQIKKIYRYVESLFETILFEKGLLQDYARGYFDVKYPQEPSKKTVTVKYNRFEERQVKFDKQWVDSKQHSKIMEALKELLN